MEKLKSVKRNITFLIGKITNDSYSATIKKLTVLQQIGFIQLVPARLVGGRWHLKVAIDHTFSAFERKANIARSEPLEFIVRLLGERQVGVALQKAEFGNEDLVLIFEKNAFADKKQLLHGLNFTEKKAKIEKKNENWFVEKTTLVEI